MGAAATSSLDRRSGATGKEEPIYVSHQGRDPVRIPGTRIYAARHRVLGEKPPLPADPGNEVNGSLFVGDKGFITTGTYGENTRLLPGEKMTGYKFPDEILTRSPGHYADWIRACKGGEPACSNFEYAAPFTEWVLLGAAALRAEGKLEWDPQQMKFTNNSAANRYLKSYRRKGWKV